MMKFDILYGVMGQPLQIGEKTYREGWGHHASGSITVLLDGHYAALGAEVGLQPCGGGSVVFRVLVDGQPRFDSGKVLSGEAARAVHVELGREALRRTMQGMESVATWPIGRRSGSHLRLLFAL